MACTLLGCSQRAAPEDHLTVEAGPLARYGVFDEYEDALARILLPASYREIQMVWIPSSSEEGSVFVEKTSDSPAAYRVTSMRMKKQLSADMLERMRARMTPDGEVPHGPDDERRVIEELAPIALRADAPISAATVDRLKSVWRAALLDARQPREISGMATDGQAIFFADWTLGTGYRSGVTRNPTPESSRIGALVSLGNRLAEYAAADPSRRRALEADLVTRAEALRARF